MTAKPAKSGRVRGALWAAGVALCLGYYASQAVRLPRPGPVGVEHPLLPLGEVYPSLYEGPALYEGPDGRVVLSTLRREGPDYTPPAIPGPPRPPLSWPRMSFFSPRRMVFGVPFGTWSLDGFGLHRVWRFPALGWAGPGQLWSTMDGSTWSEPVLIAHLKTGRTEVKPGGWQNPFLSQLYEEYGDPFDEEDDLTSILDSPLEAPAIDIAPSKELKYRIGDRRVSLLWVPGGASALYAGSDEPAPRFLRLAPGAEPVTLTRDGRTLYFTRAGHLWRLDLRKPLPQLLDEVPLPTLPEPPLD